MNHPEIQDRIKAVHGAVNQGKYVEKKAGEKRPFDDMQPQGTMKLGKTRSGQELKFGGYSSVKEMAN